ncbi:MAG: iron-sulfur cluster assembly accessory protein [candidate division Zixibacteria bacterium]|nr:iron-sulfur cluster assembly accessory protein [candidate division Zixibacteria bacterium]
MTQDTKTPAEQIVHVTPSAVAELKRLIEAENEPGLFVRVGITSGGCSGMSYNMAFDNNPSDLDREFDFDGLKVRVDLKALMYLTGTTVDYKSGLLGGGFQFSNPNAKRSCGCGSSFTC